MKRIQVAVGLLLNLDKQVLVNQRLVQDQYFEKWEFPGGKLEAGETASQALARELDEELGIKVVNSVPALFLEFDYPDRQVALHIEEVVEYLGEPIGKEGQAIKWVSITELNQLDLLSGNKPIVEYLKSKLD